MIHRTAAVEEIVYRFLPAETGFASQLAEAMNYSMKAGGKRLRPMLMQEAYLLFDGNNNELVEPFMAAIEMIHTHSLIHDDLPAIDNDQFRRGKETTHVVYGEAAGILSGDALLNYAYETALTTFSSGADGARIGSALQVLAAKTGIHGMLGGQSVDVMNENKQLSCDELNYIYQNKTSALIEASLTVGAILAGAEKEETAIMEKVGYYTGMAFQIQDDILDVTSTTLMLGKPIRSDEKNHKTTYVTIKGLKEAQDEVVRMTEEALDLLDTLPQKNEFLYKMIGFLIKRKK